MRKWITLSPGEPLKLEAALLALTADFEEAVVLSDRWSQPQGWYLKLQRFSLLAGLGALESHQGPLAQLGRALDKDDWYLGHLSYKLQEELFPLQPKAAREQIPFAPLSFFRPRWLVLNDAEGPRLGYDPRHDDEKTAGDFIERLLERRESPEPKSPQQLPQLQACLSREQYLEAVRDLQEHIHRGDIYEVNFCMEFAAQLPAETPLRYPQDLFGHLADHSAVPFLAFLRQGTRYALSASPERYLQKRGRQLFSMPMKGTAARSADPLHDAALRNELAASAKERAENIMITDLVRNDLARVAQKASVKVEELCRPYPFPRVHQSVSTISATLGDKKQWVDALLTSFPMGSMTGAPKFSALQLIDRYEQRKRGLYSGAIGYLSPEKDFDFSVVIRTLLCDTQSRRLSYTAGSAITALSDPEQEYQECLLKAAAIYQQSSTSAPNK